MAETDSAILQSLSIQSVQPAGGSGQLLVLLECDQPASAASDGEIYQTLATHEGHLRSEVAAAITRKRTPLLIYRLLPRPVSSP